MGKFPGLATIVGAAMVVASGLAHAIPLNGSLPMNGFSTTQNGANLAVSTLISSPLTLVTGVGTGAFAPVGILTNFGAHTLDFSDLVGSFSLNNANVGSFSPSSAVILTQNANFLDIVFTGMFTPAAGGLLDAFDPGQTTLRISINQSGASLSEAITLNTVTSVQVPVPASLMLLLTGVAGIAVMRRRQQLA